jgi:hypothetical protein
MPGDARAAVTLAGRSLDGREPRGTTAWLGRFIVELIDDFDGKSKVEETVFFSLAGVEYEIDLSPKNAVLLDRVRGARDDG